MHLLLTWVGDNHIEVHVFRPDGCEFFDFVAYADGVDHIPEIQAEAQGSHLVPGLVSGGQALDPAPPNAAVLDAEVPRPQGSIIGLQIHQLGNDQIIPAPPYSFSVRFKDAVVQYNRLTIPAEFAHAHNLHLQEKALLICQNGEFKVRLVARTDPIRRPLAEFTPLEIRDKWADLAVDHPNWMSKMLRFVLQPMDTRNGRVMFHVSLAV